MKLPARTVCFAGLCLAGAMVWAETAPATKRTNLGAAAAAATNVTAGKAAVVPVAVTATTERIAAGQTRLSIKPKVPAVTNLKLFDDAGKEVAATTARDGTIQAVIDSARSYLLKPPVTLERHVLSKDGVQFPARYLTITPSGATRLGGLFMRPVNVPLTWQEPNGPYATELVIGYEFEDGSENLAKPKTVTFFSEGSNARIEKDTVTITKAGSAGYQRVMLFTNQIAGETLFTARAGGLDEVKSSVVVQREPKGLSLSLPSTDIPAFGIGTGTLTISLLARDGQPLAPATDLEIQLSSRRLKQPSTVILPKDKTSVEVEVRSAGYGADEITAQSAGLSFSKKIRLVFPVAATVAAILGGSMGGTARYLRNKRKQIALLVRRIVEGLLVGILLVGAAWTGLVTINMTTGVLGTPFGAFVLAALAGYIGCTLLDRLAGKTFGELKAEAPSGPRRAPKPPSR